MRFYFIYKEMNEVSSKIFLGISKENKQQFHLDSTIFKESTMNKYGHFELMFNYLVRLYKVRKR